MLGWGERWCLRIWNQSRKSLTSLPMAVLTFSHRLPKRGVRQSAPNWADKIDLKRFCDHMRLPQAVAVRNAIPMRSWCENLLEFYRTIANYASYPRYHQSGLEDNLASGSYAQRDALLVKRYKRLGWINLSFVSKGRLKTIEILVRILMYFTFYLVWINITKYSRCLNAIP